MTAALISAQITIPRVVPMNKSPILEPFRLTTQHPPFQCRIFIIMTTHQHWNRGRRSAIAYLLQVWYNQGNQRETLKNDQKT